MQSLPTMEEHMAITIHVFRLRSISPALMHSPAGMRPKETKVGTKTIPTPEVEAEAALYRLSNGQLYWPSENILSSLIKGCTGKRIGKRGASALVQAGVFVSEIESPLFDPETNKPITTWEIDSRRVVVQRQGIVRSRARIAQWY